MFVNPWALLFEFWASSLTLSPMHGKQGDWRRVQTEHAVLLLNDYLAKLARLTASLR